mgnify:CR=1 FL=1
MPDNTRVFVGGLPYAMTEDDVKAFFAPAGNVVSVFLPIEKETGRKRGFGFVEMSTEEEAKAAIDMFNGQDFGGRNISVSEARPMQPRTDRRF